MFRKNQETANIFKSRYTRLGFQSLENRELKHADVTLGNDGTLTIKPEATADMARPTVASGLNVVVSKPSSTVVEVVSTDPGGFKQSTQFPVDKVTNIKFLGSEANDRYTNFTAIKDSAYGYGGNDVLKGGEQNSYIVGGEGNDTIQGRRGNDIIVGGNGSDVIQGGAGADYIFGDAGNDDLYGNEGDDRIVAGLGDDDIFAGDGNDSVWGGDGEDWIYGDAGNDWLSGMDGNDLVVGGIGDDTLYGGNGNDEILGEAGNDYLNGEAGNDKLIGGAGRDTQLGGTGVNTILEGKYAAVSVAELKVLQVDDYDGPFVTDRDEVYFNVSGSKNGVPISPYNVSVSGELAKNDTRNNIGLWSGALEVGESVSLTVKVMEQDSGFLSTADDLIGEFQVTLKNTNGVITRTITPVRSMSKTGSNFNANGGDDASYNLAFAFAASNYNS